MARPTTGVSTSVVHLRVSDTVLKRARTRARLERRTLAALFRNIIEDAHPAPRRKA